MEKLLDDRNRGLYEDVRKQVNLTLKKVNQNYYMAYTQGNEAIIYVPNDNENPSSFAHELLHINFKTIGVLIGNGLINSIRSKNQISTYFSNELLEQIGNCLDHVKMLPIFVQMGYPIEEFVEDYFVVKLTENEINNIKSNFFKKGFFGSSYNKNAIDLFIGKYFAVRACPNNSFDYSNALFELENLEPKLYSVLDSYWKQWLDFDIYHPDPIFNNYHVLNYDFVENLEGWFNGKKVN